LRQIAKKYTDESPSLASLGKNGGMIIVAITLGLLAQKPMASVPYNWKNVEIVGGGFVTGIITHPHAKGVMYARTDIGGAYRWNPTTSRWVPIEDFITRSDWNLYGTESVAIDPNDPKRVYIAAGTYTNEWGQNGAILRSRDQGNTWERINLPFKNGGNEDGRSIGERLTVDPNDSKVLFFATRKNGLLRSQDYGSTWKLCEKFPITGRTNRIGTGWVSYDPSAKAGSTTQRLYAGATGLDQNLITSADGGTTWSTVPRQPAKLWPHHARWLTKDQLVIAYCDSFGPNGVSNGAVYKFNTKTGRFMNITPEEPGAGNTFGYGGITVDPSNPDVIMVSTLDRWARHDTVFRSADGGVTWINLGDKAKRDSSRAKYLDWGRKEPEFGHWIGDVEIDPFNPNRAWYVTGATIWGTDNLLDADKGKPTNWVPRAEGLEETAVLDLVSPPEGAHVISALGDIAGFAHFDLDKSPPTGMWTNPQWNTTNDVDYAGFKPLTVIRVGRGQGSISHDGGLTWKEFSAKPEGIRNTGSAAINADANVIVQQFGGSTALWSDDEGVSWHKSTGAVTSGRVVADRKNPSYFYIHDEKSGGVWFSSNSGRSFHAVTNKFPSDRGRIYPSPDEEGVVWIPLNKGVARCNLKTDEVSIYQPNQFIEQIAFGAPPRGGTTPTAYVIGKFDGVEGIYRSTDGCNSFQRINDAKTGYGTADCIEGDPKVFGRVYLGANGRGVIYGDPK
jgi:xyloglucan-specific exo-beta-1,4-glucanase